MRRVRFVAASTAVLALLAGCEQASPAVTTPNGSRLELPADVQPLDFESGTAIIHAGNGETHRLNIEIADTEAQRERGLMYRTSMPEGSGMLFIYPEEQEGGFWMFNTLIPLSVAYAGNDGVIFQITDMAPCESPYASICARNNYPARAPFQYGLEVNQGFFTHRGIGIGDRIEYTRE